MPRFILTGAPGAGKTALLRLLERDGFDVVDEAATDVIALGFALGRHRPWEEPDFVDTIVTLQRQREVARSVAHRQTVFFDRSPICTLALSRYSGLEPSAALAADVERVVGRRVYEPVVFFVENLGSVETTAARQISFEDSLRFEQVHRDTYVELGYDLVSVPAGGLRERADRVLASVREVQR
jgi:predicted ATPase